ncbi:hypothetical protein NLI96_g1390 [Meripilus lineatus]|uniref:Major facilitator superfamily (MFS) profile domain-containing protein n=1 Tax=Meripilus lineatus TaxID=2056292 RepID=A0AAD5VAQ4_9APHY|nr:hypothetical protein NLI96_g1390 [Physisporinus lineatus]
MTQISAPSYQNSQTPAPPITTLTEPDLSWSQTVTSYSDIPEDTCSSPSISPSSTVVDIPASKCRPLSFFHLFFAHVGAALTLFLATTDATIVSTCLPTISSEFGASQVEYTWVGVSYMLTQTAFQPLYGKLSDLIGRKTVLYSSMLIFVVGSMLCGAAQNMLWLILARALAGIGGGGIRSGLKRLALPGVAPQSRDHCWEELLVDISIRGNSFGTPSTSSDYARFLFMSGSTCVVIGFSFASDFGWLSGVTLSLIIVGPLILIIGGLYEVSTRREALFPASSFKNITTVSILIINLLHNFAFNAGTFYLAIYFQSVKGETPLLAGVDMLPYSLGSALVSMPTAWFIGYWQRRRGNTSGQNISILLGLGIALLGFCLMTQLDERTVHAAQAIFPLIAGLGLGMCFHAPYQVFTKTLAPKEIASGTSAFFLVRFTGATVGLSVAGAIFHSRLSHTLPSEVSPSLDLELFSLLQPSALRSQALHAVSLSIRVSMLLQDLSLDDETRIPEEKSINSGHAQSTNSFDENEKSNV